MKRISKVLMLLFIIIIITGCGNMMDTPTKKVESLFNKYQSQDESVIEQLDKVVEDAGNLTKEQKEKYITLMKRQYKNMSYKIMNEVEDGNNATVTVELHVFDYGKAIADSENYLINNRSEFVDDTENDIVNAVKYMDYKIDNMSNITDKVTYTINFTLTKVDNEWRLTDLNDIDRLKLHGLYY